MKAAEAEREGGLAESRASLAASLRVAAAEAERQGLVESLAALAAKAAAAELELGKARAAL